MNATKADRSKSEPALFSLGKRAVLTSDLLYKFLRLRFLTVLASPEDEGGDESLYMLSVQSLI